MKKKREKPSFSCELIKTLRTEQQDKYNRIDLQIVKWSTGKRRVLEKRRMWTLKDGTLRFKQLVGFTQEDVDFIVSNQEEIKETLKEGVQTNGQS